MATIPIKYTIYGHLREGDWIAYQDTVVEVIEVDRWDDLINLTLRYEGRHFADVVLISAEKPCVRILPVEDDAF